MIWCAFVNGANEDGEGIWHGKSAFFGGRL